MGTSEVDTIGGAGFQAIWGRNKESLSLSPGSSCLFPKVKESKRENVDIPRLLFGKNNKDASLGGVALTLQDCCRRSGSH